MPMLSWNNFYNIFFLRVGMEVKITIFSTVHLMQPKTSNWRADKVKLQLIRYSLVSSMFWNPNLTHSHYGRETRARWHTAMSTQSEVSHIQSHQLKDTLSTCNESHYKNWKCFSTSHTISSWWLTSHKEQMCREYWKAVQKRATTLQITGKFRLPGPY